MNTSFVARLDEELDVCVHKWDSHRNIAAIRENIFSMIAELLDKTEDVVLSKSDPIKQKRVMPIDHNSIPKNDPSIQK